MKDPYVILGVAREADPDAIKSAYRAMLNKYHPDKAGKDPAAIEKFFEIRAAWECLSDSHRRDPVDRDAPGPDAANPHSTPHPNKPPTRSAFGPSSAESPGGSGSADRASTPAAYSLLDSLRNGAVTLVIHGVYGVGGVVFALLALVLFG